MLITLLYDSVFFRTFTLNKNGINFVSNTAQPGITSE